MEWTALPTCPYCGTVDHDWWDGLGPKHDGDEWTTVCGHCGKEFRVTMCVEATFRTEISTRQEANTGGATETAGELTRAQEGEG
jgi:hypothetical protein